MTPNFMNFPKIYMLSSLLATIVMLKMQLFQFLLPLLRSPGAEKGVEM
jgi:hypothetical protein